MMAEFFLKEQIMGSLEERIGAIVNDWDYPRRLAIALIPILLSKPSGSSYELPDDKIIKEACADYMYFGWKSKVDAVNALYQVLVDSFDEKLRETLGPAFRIHEGTEFQGFSPFPPLPSGAREFVFTRNKFARSTSRPVDLSVYLEAIEGFQRFDQLMELPKRFWAKEEGSANAHYVKTDSPLRAIKFLVSRSRISSKMFVKNRYVFL